MALGFVKSIGSSAVGLAKDAGSKAVDTAKDAGSKVVDTAKDAGGKVVDTAKSAGSKVVDTAKSAGGKVVDTAKDVGRDAVHLSREALEFKAEQERNFANGVLEWGKGTVNTVVGIATHPVETLKAVDKLASNPVINPVGGTIRAAIQGKNPLEAYKDGVGDLKDLGQGLYQGYKDVYDEHGVAGLAGNLAPDVAIALLTGGSGTAARAGAAGTGRAVAREVAQETAETAVTRGTGGAARQAAKEVAGELAPGPEDVVNESREMKEKNFLERLIENFSI